MDPTTRRRALAFGGTAVASLVAGCSGDGGGNRPANAVDMTDDLAYEPESITVSTGTTVTWRTIGSVGHSVTAYEDEIPDDGAYFASGGFDSETAARGDIEGGIVEGGETYEHTFEVAGEYEYFCVPHEGAGMTGTVRVE